MDGYQKMMAPLFAAAGVARARSPEKMMALVHRTFVFDSGMSVWCKVCGARQQSLQPSEHFDHYDGCPLKAIAAAFAPGKWPDRDGDDVSWELDDEPTFDEMYPLWAIHVPADEPEDALVLGPYELERAKERLEEASDEFPAAQLRRCRRIELPMKVATSFIPDELGEALDLYAGEHADMFTFTQWGDFEDQLVDAVEVGSEAAAIAEIGAVVQKHYTCAVFEFQPDTPPNPIKKNGDET